MKREFTWLSRDGMTQIHGIEWKPEGRICAVLQMCHGMVEYIDRYDEFAEYLCSHGFYVVGHDHLGHGKSVQSETEYGFFHETSGNEYVVGDLHKLREMTQKRYPDVPYFIFGTQYGIVPDPSVHGDVWTGAYRRECYGNRREAGDSSCSREGFVPDYSGMPGPALPKCTCGQRGIWRI